MRAKHGTFGWELGTWEQRVQWIEMKALVVVVEFSFAQSQWALFACANASAWQLRRWPTLFGFACDKWRHRGNPFSGRRPLIAQLSPVVCLSACHDWICCARDSESDF